jgi:hypothetical protein
MSNYAKDTKDEPDAHWHLRAFVHGAVILAYSALEAAFNEFVTLRGLAEESPLDENQRQFISSFRQDESNTLQRFNGILDGLGKVPLPMGSSIYQNADLVRVLRNMLVHPTPGRVTTVSDNQDFDYSAQQDIVKRLRSALKLTKKATFPDDVLNHKCASWAVSSCEKFLHEFVVVSGVDIGFLTDPNRKRTISVVS